ncbi:hypothetical protein HNW77_12980 [Komagataeibacter sp. AV436]|uniref:Uncharacterized protein n=1 Tax=Komagataeibacter melomenusus TaxID=2766578 RepID=A0ABX2AI09_9PROT|nr:hypothetical protein [Komagataeibacter melomenusus]MBV1831570.1 hypothetical protein [Komagataeibacter melomenusus]NPC67281.1 hypothetical protein [Komagataeibacter melomenusus]
MDYYDVIMTCKNSMAHPMQPMLAAKAGGAVMGVAKKYGLKCFIAVA